MAGEAGVLPERYAEPRPIGQGGMGEIYVARDRELGRQVAIKLLDERFAGDESLRRRFQREALTAARLSGQRHVVTIFDVGEWRGRPFIVMEYLSGGTLGDRAREGRVQREQTLAWLAQAAAALDAAHAEGIVHRDVKPANLLFDARGELQVVDFGIARAVDDTGGMTAAGTMLGTAGYLSPEQARGEGATPESDRYSLAVVAYELLTGGRPFERGSATAEAAAHIQEPVPPASERGVGLPRSVDRIFERALAKDPARRYESAAAFVRALSSALAGGEGTTRVLPAAPRTAGPPPPRRGRAPLVLALLLGGLLLALLGGAVAAALLSGDGDDSPEQAPAGARQTVTQEVTVGGEATTVVQTITQPPEEETEPSAESEIAPAEAAALNDEAFTQHMQEGDYEGALPLLRRAVPALRGTYSDDFRYEAYAEYNLGKTLAELGRCEEALPHLERSEDLQGEEQPITEAKEQCGA
jgi:eukaryotic-like serine/threonine-protein kinase